MLVVVAALTTALHVSAQGTFGNLNFESAVIVPISGDPYGSVQFAQAFPGWTGTINGSLETRALYNNMFLDSSGIGIQGPGSSLNLSGNYTAMLQSGYALSGPPTQALASLSQTAVVPAVARSLQFKATAYGPFEVTLNDQSLSLTPILIASGYTVYGVNIEAFAGISSKLTFTAIPKQTAPIITTLFFDDIVFPSQLIPEPSSLGLFGLGAGIATGA